MALIQSNFLKFIKKKKEKKLKKLLFIKNIILFIIIASIFFILIINMIKYKEKSVYDDVDVIVREHQLGYNIYKKDGTLKEVKFLSGKQESNVDLLTALSDSIIFKNKNNNNDFIKILEQVNSYKTKNTFYKGYEIRNIKKEDNGDYVILYTHKTEETGYKYCFVVNKIIPTPEKETTDKNTFCLNKVEKNLEFISLRYNDYIFIVIDTNIYIYQIDINNIIGVINSPFPIKSIAKNENKDIKVSLSGITKNIKADLIEYYLLRRVKLNLDIIKISINDLFL